MKKKRHLNVLKEKYIIFPQLSHENIVSMIDVDEEDDCFILSWNTEGPTLAEYIHSHGPLSVETAIQFTEQILSGIKHMNCSSRY